MDAEKGGSEHVGFGQPPFIDPKVLSLARSSREEFRLVRRAQMICLAHQGVPIAELVEAGYGQARTIRTWLNRYHLSPSVESLKDGPRSGRPCVFDGATRQGVIAFVCQYPDEWGLSGLTHWSLREVAALMPQFIGDAFTMSHETIRRILRKAILKPHRSRYYLRRTDPNFLSKALNLIRLYDDHRRSPDRFHLLCVDELTSIQALERRYPTLPMRPGLIERREFEYVRHGTRCLLAAFDVATGFVLGQVYPNRKRPTFLRFLNEILKWRPDKTIHIVMDNLNTHMGPVIDEWLKAQEGRVVFHYTPFHGSWLNQVEIWFGLVKAKCLRRGNFTSLDDLEAKIMNYIHLWNYFFAHPFDWTFTEEKFNTWYEERQASYSSLAS